MNFPHYGRDGKTPFLQEVIKAGFDSYYEGSLTQFFELLGRSIIDHNIDKANPPLGHFNEWVRSNDAIFSQGYSLQHHSTEQKFWVELKRVMLSQLQMKMTSTRIHSQSLIEGSTPNMDDRELLEILVSALGICLVWFEVVEGQIRTRYYSQGQEGTWVFFVYLGREGQKLYSFSNSGFQDHLPTSRPPWCTFVGKTPVRAPITIGQVWPIEEMVSDTGDDVLVNLVHLLTQTTMEVAINQVPTDLLNRLIEFGHNWTSLQEKLRASSVGDRLNLREIETMFLRFCAPDPTPEPPGVIEKCIPPHSLSMCFKFDDSPSTLKQHLMGTAHKFHLSCLREYILQEREKGEIVRCPKCPIPFTEAFLQEVIPNYSTLKRDIIQRRSADSKTDPR